MTECTDRSQCIYIYAHVDEFESPMYVGVGVEKRAWEMKHRDGYHRSWLISLPHDQDYVQIWHRCLEREEALKLERKYIREYDPRFNITERIK